MTELAQKCIKLALNPIKSIEIFLKILYNLIKQIIHSNKGKIFMQTNFYQVQKFPDGNFPIRFHTDRLYFGEDKQHSHPYIKNNRQNEIQPHWHESLEILRIKKGSANITVDDKQFNAKANDVIVINSNQLHVIRVSEGECLYEVLGLEYNFCMAWDFPLDKFYYKNLINDQRINLLFDKIAKENYGQKSFFQPIVMSGCIEILGLLSRQYNIQKPASTATLEKIQIVRQMMQYISIRFYSQNILKDLSELLKYNPFYLTHIFSEITGVTVKAYQLEIRFNYAKKMLLQNRLTILEIAENCGYANATSFTLAFRNKTGKTPSEYKRKKLTEK